MTVEHNRELASQLILLTLSPAKAYIKSTTCNVFKLVVRALIGVYIWLKYLQDFVAPQNYILLAGTVSLNEIQD